MNLFQVACKEAVNLGIAGPRSLGSNWLRDVYNEMVKFVPKYDVENINDQYNGRQLLDGEPGELWNDIREIVNDTADKKVTNAEEESRQMAIQLIMRITDEREMQEIKATIMNIDYWK